MACTLLVIEIFCDVELESLGHATHKVQGHVALVLGLVNLIYS